MTRRALANAVVGSTGEAWLSELSTDEFAISSFSTIPRCVALSIVITPSPAHLRVEPAPAGRLAASLLSVTVAGLADPQRFRRGKTYLADNAISRLELSEGVLLATVAGNRADPYYVTITVETMARPDDLGQVPERSHVARLIPAATTCCSRAPVPIGTTRANMRLRRCWRSPVNCPVGPSCLRSGDAVRSAPERPKVGSRARGDRHLRLVQPAPPKSPFETPEWREFIGADLATPHCDVSTAVLALPTMHLDRTDVGEVIRSAWQTLALYRRET